MSRASAIIQALTALQQEGRIGGWVHDPEAPEPEPGRSRGTRWIIAAGVRQWYLGTSEVEAFLFGTTV